MKKSIGSMFLFFVLLAVLVMSGCAPAPSPAPTTTAKPGVWKATTNKNDTFTFVVNKKGTGINEYDFGGVNVKTDDEDGYPIKDSKFGSVLSGVTINGELTSYTTATGTWKNDSGSGTWTAQWSGE